MSYVLRSPCCDLPCETLMHIVGNIRSTVRLPVALASRSFLCAVRMACKADGSEFVVTSKYTLSSKSSIEWAYDFEPKQRPPWSRYELCGVLAEVGNLDDLIWTFDKLDHSASSNVITSAACGGHLNIVQWARMEGCNWTSFDCAAAARGGHLHVLQWLHKNGCPLKENTCCAAAFHGQLHILRYLYHNEQRHLFTEDAFEYAAKNGHIEAFKFLCKIAYSIDCEIDEQICITAVENGHIDILKWAFENGIECTESVIASAAELGDLHTIEWLRKRGCSWNYSACAAAAMGGHLSLLMWLRDNGCEWNETTCICAAENGHVDILEWAKGAGCSMNSLACLGAARNGQLDALKWLMANGCEWHQTASIVAKIYSHKEVLEWILANGGPQLHGSHVVVMNFI